MSYLKCDPTHIPEIIHGKLLVNPRSTVKVKFYKDKFRTVQKSPGGGKFISKLLSGRNNYARQRLQEKYCERLIQSYIADGIPHIIVEDDQSFTFINNYTDHRDETKSPVKITVTEQTQQQPITLERYKQLESRIS